MRDKEEAIVMAVADTRYGFHVIHHSDRRNSNRKDDDHVYKIDFWQYTLPVPANLLALFESFC